jgi:hypothetical protein
MPRKRAITFDYFVIDRKGNDGVTMSIDKLAQRKRIRDKAREFFEPSNKKLQKQLSDAEKAERRKKIDPSYDVTPDTLAEHDVDFAKYLLLLRKQDDLARSILLGKTGKYKGTSVRTMINLAAKLAAGKDYVAAAGQLSRFYSTLKTVLTELDTVDKTLITGKNRTMVGPMSKDLGKDILDYYESIKGAGSKTFGFEKQASVFDWFKDQFYYRRRAVKYLENNYPDVVSFKRDLEFQIEHANEVLTTVVDHFNSLSEARSTSDTNGYQAILNILKQDISTAQQAYNKFFIKEVGPYTVWLKENLDKISPAQEEKLPEEPAAAPGAEPAAEQAIVKTDEPAGTGTGTGTEPQGGYYDITSVPDPSEARPKMPTNVHQMVMRPSLPAMIDLEKEVPPADKPADKSKIKAGPRPVAPGGKEEKKSPPGGPVSPLSGQALPTKPPGQRTASHEDFITKIASMDDDDMQAIGHAILEYSQELQDQDPIASIKLMAVAEALL